MKFSKIEKSQKKITLFKDCFIHKVKKNKKHKAILFNMYNSRKNNMRISSNTNLKLEKHNNFVQNHPYRLWFLVCIKDHYIGNFYITLENIISLNLYEVHVAKYNKIISAILKKIKPLKAVLSIKRGEFTINLSPQNKKIEKLLKNNNWKLIQKTYILDK
ncbi:hypothetical protein N9J74_02185 [Candidatus Pelagibacter sp.]|nr:hypothetical protein [Candidatus Pelagibacter sp.]